jgi:hypothetical protein
MQTFVHEGSDFDLGARVLDRQRLIKQAVEGYQILKVLAGQSKGWKNHPAVKMWAGHEGWLYLYVMAHIDEIERRGYKNTTRSLIDDLMNLYFSGWESDTAPAWLYDDRVKVSHRGRLFEKDPVHYSMYAAESKIYQKFVCCDRCNYMWPTHTTDYRLELVS